VSIPSPSSTLYPNGYLSPSFWRIQEQMYDYLTNTIPVQNMKLQPYNLTESSIECETLNNR
jgi:hypothetical protein